MNNIEEWRTINGHPSYVVSNLGRVMTVKTGRILKQKNSRNKYMAVGLYISHKRYKWASVHRLVAEAFIDNFDCGLCVDHIDKDSLNNNADSLRCVTSKENANNRAPSIKTIINILELHEHGSSPSEIRAKLDWRQ